MAAPRMGSSFELLVVLVVGIVLAAPFVVAWLLLRVQRLEREVAVLRRASSGGGAPRARAAAAEADPWESTLPPAVASPRGVAGRPEPREEQPPAAPVAAGGAAAQPALEPAARAHAQPSHSHGAPESRPALAATATASPPRPIVRTPPAPRERIEWERWLGVRGAGVLGGVFAALAAVLLFRHAIQEGWITPAMRVSLGLVAGLALAGTGTWLRPRGYRYVPDALIGAGAVAHYAALWAAAQLYGFWPLPVSFALMAVVTAATCALALRHRSQLVALIGLAGGFATPLLLATAEDRPFGLFGYLLLLNLGLLFVGRRLVTPWIGLAAVGGTALLQGLWFAARYEPDRALFALGMLAVFALLFAFQPRRAGLERSMAPTQAAGLIWAFVFALHVSGKGGVELGLLPLASFAALLLAASCVLARQADFERLAIVPVVGTLALLASWRFGRILDPQAAWGLAIAAPLLALVPLAFLLFEARRARGESASRTPTVLSGLGAAAGLALVGMGALLFTISLQIPSAPFGALVVGFLALVALAFLRARSTGAGGLLPVLAAVASLAVLVHLGFQAGEQAAGSRSTALGLLVLAASFHLAASFLRADKARGHALAAAGLYALPPLLLHSGLESLGEPLAPLRLATVALLTLSALAAALRGAGTLLLGAALLASALALRWPPESVTELARQSELTPWSAAARMVGLGLFLAAAFSFAPRLPRRMLWSRTALWIAGLAPLTFFLALSPAMRGLGWHAGEPWLPAIFLLVAMSSCAALRGRLEETRSSHGLAAVLLGALALSRAIDIQPAQVFLGLSALGLAFLWRRTAHQLVKLAALAAALGALLVSVAQFAEHGHYARTGIVLLNALAFAHAAALAGPLVLASFFARRETERLEPWERSNFGQIPYGLVLSSIAAAAILFLWLTLTVMELWSSGPRVTFPHPRSASFDLALSLAWAAYGLALLGFGLWRRSAGPRWASLLVLLLAIGKVFLRDLGHLEGLARVGSLAGLALSLTLVSLLYQRFVFGRGRKASAQPDLESVP